MSNNVPAPSTIRQNLQFIAQMWPLIIGAGGLLLGITTTKADVARLQAEVATSEQKIDGMADRLARIETSVVNIDRTVNKIGDKLDAR